MLASPLSLHAAFVSGPGALRHPRHRHLQMVASVERPTISTAGSMTREERLRSRYGFTYEPEGGWETDDVGFSYDELANSMLEIKSYARGEVSATPCVDRAHRSTSSDLRVRAPSGVLPRPASRAPQPSAARALRWSRGR